MFPQSRCSSHHGMISQAITCVRQHQPSMFQQQPDLKTLELRDSCNTWMAADAA